MESYSYYLKAASKEYFIQLLAGLIYAIYLILGLGLSIILGLSLGNVYGVIIALIIAGFTIAFAFPLYIRYFYIYKLLPIAKIGTLLARQNISTKELLIRLKSDKDFIDLIYKLDLTRSIEVSLKSAPASLGVSFIPNTELRQIANSAIGAMNRIYNMRDECMLLYSFAKDKGNLWESLRDGGILYEKYKKRIVRNSFGIVYIVVFFTSIGILLNALVKYDIVNIKFSILLPIYVSFILILLLLNYYIDLHLMFVSYDVISSYSVTKDDILKYGEQYNVIKKITAKTNLKKFNQAKQYLSAENLDRGVILMKHLKEKSLSTFQIEVRMSLMGYSNTDLQEINNKLKKL